MTEAECITILGEAWHVGKGKVDWFSFIPGKISTEYAALLMRRSDSFY